MSAGPTWVDPHQANRPLITDAVVELVRAVGWSGTTMSSLARAAGVSRQTLYNRYGSRESLAEAYVTRELDLALDAAEQAMKLFRREPRIALTTAVEALLDVVSTSLTGAVSAASEPDRFEALTALALAHSTERLARALAQLCPGRSERERLAVCDLVCRLTISNAMVPPADRDEAVRAIVQMLASFVGAPDLA